MLRTTGLVILLLALLGCTNRPGGNENQGVAPVTVGEGNTPSPVATATITPTATAFWRV